MHIYKIKRRAVMLINQYKDSIARKKIVLDLHQMIGVKSNVQHRFRISILANFPNLSCS